MRGNGEFKEGVFWIFGRAWNFVGIVELYANGFSLGFPWICVHKRSDFLYYFHFFFIFVDLSNIIHILQIEPHIDRSSKSRWNAECKSWSKVFSSVNDVVYFRFVNPKQFSEINLRPPPFCNFLSNELSWMWGFWNEIVFEFDVCHFDTDKI